jgi:lysophospholipase L1-like esterase
MFKNLLNCWASQPINALLLCAFALLPCSNSARAQTAETATIQAGSKRILFLGDSITHAGGYVASIETALRVQAPSEHPTILNLGLPSETVSGLSEPGHAGGAFPRPDLHERLTRILDLVKPDLVVACYGMNCGMYYPLSEDRFAKFKAGMEKLHQAVEKRGVQIIHLTPAYFDALPIRDRLLPEGLDEYRQPFAKYDDVLEAYSTWLLAQRERGWVVLDVHGAMKSAVAKRRTEDPNFTFAGDGVHPDAAGQAVIASPLASFWGLKLDTNGLPTHPKAKEIFQKVSEKQNLLKLSWLTATKHIRPGIPEGQPLEQAGAQAKLLDEQIDALLK